MQHVPLQFWQRWAELKADGFDYEYVQNSNDSDADSVDDWLAVAHSDAAGDEEVAATATEHGGSSSPDRLRTYTTQASKSSQTHSKDISPARLRRITGLSLPPTSGVGSVAEARSLRELAPRVLPVSQLLDRRGMHAMDDLDQLRQRLSRVRTALQDADKEHLARTLDADVLWVVGLQPQEKQPHPSHSDDDDEEDDDEVPMFKGGPKDSLGGGAMPASRSPSELALRHVALAKAAAVLAQAGQQRHRDGATAEFRRHFLAILQQDLENLDWFGAGQVGTLEHEESKHQDTLRVLRRAGINVRGMRHNTALDGAVPVASEGGQGGVAARSPPPRTRVPQCPRPSLLSAL